VQADALKDWLQTVRGEETVNDLGGYDVVAYKRVAHKKDASSRPQWQGAPGVILGTCRASEFNGGWLFRQMAPLRSRREEKPAFHLRRAWSRAEAETLRDQLPAAVAAEVERLMPVLREIWALSRR
jgi:hypothetical protein